MPSAHWPAEPFKKPGSRDSVPEIHPAPPVALAWHGQSGVAAFPGAEDPPGFLPYQKRPGTDVRLHNHPNSVGAGSGIYLTGIDRSWLACHDALQRTQRCFPAHFVTISRSDLRRGWLRPTAIPTVREPHATRSRLVCSGYFCDNDAMFSSSAGSTGGLVMTCFDGQCYF